jgi:hypothetical protein
MVRPTRSNRSESRSAVPDSLTPRISHHQTIVTYSRAFATSRDRGVSRCVSHCRSNGVSRWASNIMGPVTKSHPESRSPCGSAPQAPSAKATSHGPTPRGCGRRRRRLTRIPHVPRCRSPRVDRFVPGCGRRPLAPSVIPRSTRSSGPVTHGAGKSTAATPRPICHAESRRSDIPASEQRDQDDQQPPTGAAGVVRAAHGYAGLSVPPTKHGFPLATPRAGSAARNDQRGSPVHEDRREDRTDPRHPPLATAAGRTRA